MSYTQNVEDSIKADDLENLLDHIAWEQTIQPALSKFKTNYQNMLVQSVLGSQIIDTKTNGIVSKEMLAGRISGIDWLETFLVNILNRGERASNALRVDNFILNNNN